MKQLGIFAVASLMAVSCNSQQVAQETVPAVVVNALKAQFPNAVNTEWEKKGALYEADFDGEGGTDITVQVDASGKLLQQKEELAITSLTPGIQALLQKDFKAFSVDEFERVQKDGNVWYQLELDGKGLKALKDKKLVLTAEGQPVAGAAYWD